MVEKELTEPPKAERPSRDSASIEIYRSVNRRYSWRVVVVAKDESESGLREAKALALTLEDEIHDELAEHVQKRQSQRPSTGRIG